MIYAGGLQKWQQVSKMVDAMLVNQDNFEFRFFCPNPDALQQKLPPQLKTSMALIIESKSNEEILAEYQQSHFGFILHENNIVNQVACPTKLIEYLALGVIPIIDSPEIGDFPSLGMQSISIGDF
ncbi:MAG: glycosyl transferase family 2, partial [Brevefilum sp.]